MAAALFVLLKKPSGVPKLAGTGVRQYVIRTSRSIGVDKSCDLISNWNARLLCSWYCTTLP